MFWELAWKKALHYDVKMKGFLPVLLWILMVSGLRAEDGRGSVSLQEYGAESRMERRRGRVEWRGGEGVWFGYDHDYRAFSFADADPVGNGHVHRTGPFLVMENEGYRFELNPALAVSSNVLRDQRDIRFADVEPAFSVQRRFPAPGGGRWVTGVRGDSRTGAYRVLPVLAYEIGEGDRFAAIFGFPDSSLRWHAAETVALRVEAGPDGGVWYLRSRDFGERVRLEEERWHVRAGVEWTPISALTLGAFWDAGFARQWRTRGADGERIEVSPPDRGVGVVQVLVRF
jgi:hypothetical protein